MEEEDADELAEGAADVLSLEEVVAAVVEDLVSAEELVDVTMEEVEEGTEVVAIVEDDEAIDSSYRLSGNILVLARPVTKEE